MLSFARRNAMALKAALVVCALGATACDGGQPAAPPGTAADGASTTTGVQTAGSSGQAQTSITVAGSSTPLDTTTWVLPPPFYAAGQEPFWRLEIEDGYFSFQRSGLPPIEEPLVQPKQENSADVFMTGALKVSIKREACETEQGGKGDFSATVGFDGLTFDGCASSGTLVSVAKSAEAAAVVEAVAQIDACLAKLGEPALVTGVVEREDGDRMAVGLRAKNGTDYDCGAETATNEIAYLDPIEPGSQPAYMKQMRFLREGTAAPACDDAQEVRSGDKPIGRMLGKKCKF